MSSKHKVLIIVLQCCIMNIIFWQVSKFWAMVAASHHKFNHSDSLTISRLLANLANLATQALPTWAACLHYIFIPAYNHHTSTLVLRFLGSWCTKLTLKNQTIIKNVSANDCGHDSRANGKWRGLGRESFCRKPSNYDVCWGSHVELSPHPWSPGSDSVLW